MPREAMSGRLAACARADARLRPTGGFPPLMWPTSAIGPATRTGTFEAVVIVLFDVN